MLRLADTTMANVSKRYVSSAYDWIMKELAVLFYNASSVAVVISSVALLGLSLEDRGK